jgi:hypothetical protein
LSAALRELNPKSAEETAQIIELAYPEYPESAEAMRGILLTGDVAPDPAHWPDIVYIMGALTGEVWPPERLKRLANQVDEGLDSHPASSVGVSPVLPK